MKREYYDYSKWLNDYYHILVWYAFFGGALAVGLGLLLGGYF